MPDPSLHDLLAEAAADLVRAGFTPADAAIDVEVLARDLLDWSRATLLVRRREPPPAGFRESLAPLVARRAARVPVAYLTGRREFWGLDFEVTDAVLIPRPETETLVEEAIARMPEASPFGAPRAMDVGTGSGCVAVALAATDADVRVIATDSAPAALRVAGRNVRRHRLQSRIALVAGDLVTMVAAGAPCVDVIVSNPPYVPEDSPDVTPDVRLYEPAAALYAGADGLDVIRRLVAECPPLVPPGGYLLFEFGAAQHAAVTALVEGRREWHLEAVRHDLAGLPRVACLRRSTAPIVTGV
jgi:release factor glutamine methyltransferase